ncbi:hypothetical protein [Dyella flagellata]|uniref:Lipoprotein n=1 Tax=Dyella flagellata TaxID=1867833 RepID=A0ABQ5X9J2_9GAMM|nr:hypothetical protein [Dyella flagellata]GLQ87587.1 hypothetical protein GCM10007898_11530 [Dyella flagellata]
MKQRNTVIFRGFTDLGLAAVAALGLLLAGCSQGVKKPQTANLGANAEAVTGIPACDSYLSSYLACHRAAGTYPADALQTHYQAIRDTLLQQANDPSVRPYLANRCMGLAQQMHDALQGRTCTSQNAASR